MLHYNEAGDELPESEARECTESNPCVMANCHWRFVSHYKKELQRIVSEKKFPRLYFFPENKTLTGGQRFLFFDDVPLSPTIIRHSSALTMINMITALKICLVYLISHPPRDTGDC